jgi:Inositol polyphosphate kinase
MLRWQLRLPVNYCLLRISYLDAVRIPSTSQHCIGLSPGSGNLHIHDTAWHLSLLRCADGMLRQEGQQFLCVQNLCSGIQQPNIIDIKIGFNTTYPWADDAYNAKNRYYQCSCEIGASLVASGRMLPLAGTYHAISVLGDQAMHTYFHADHCRPSDGVVRVCSLVRRLKDSASSQSTHGFKVSGMQVHEDGKRSVMNKQQCAAVQVVSILHRFGAAHGCDHAACVWETVLTCVQRLQRWCACHRDDVSWTFRSVSLLVISEGAVVPSEQPRVTCHLIDFAHCFVVPSGIDQNCLNGLVALHAALEALVGI